MSNLHGDGGIETIQTSLIMNPAIANVVLLLSLLVLGYSANVGDTVPFVISQ